MLAIFVLISAIFLSLRIIQRLYYLLNGHKYYWSYFPRTELESFLKKNNIIITEHTFRSKHDNVSLKYRRLGNGPKYILLTNGVGTDFFMWLPALQAMFNSFPSLFSNITLIVPSYRFI